MSLRAKERGRESKVKGGRGGAERPRSERQKALIELRTDRQRDRARANVCSAYLRKSLDPLSPFGDLS
jgi:hypothetical protein